jgi:hypothetical protein
MSVSPVVHEPPGVPELVWMLVPLVPSVPLVPAGPVRLLPESTHALALQE